MRVVNLNVTWLGYVFVFISFVHMHGEGVISNWTSKVKGVEKLWTLMNKGGGVLKIRRLLWTSYVYCPLFHSTSFSATF